jgi:hypothetical protein
MRRCRCSSLALCASAGFLALTAQGARADHGAGLRPEAMNPWVAAMLWGALGLAVAMIVAIIVMLFTRASVEDESDDGGRP